LLAGKTWESCREWGDRAGPEKMVFYQNLERPEHDSKSNEEKGCLKKGLLVPQGEWEADAWLPEGGWNVRKGKKNSPPGQVCRGEGIVPWCADQGSRGSGLGRGTTKRKKNIVSCERQGLVLGPERGGDDQCQGVLRCQQTTGEHLEFQGFGLHKTSWAVWGNSCHQFKKRQLVRG